MTRELPLFAELPRLAASVPWRPLCDAPTPVEPLTLTALPRGGLFQKRDDRVSSIYGGNKIRRFEFLLADAERRGARSLVTAGGLASTQVMATVLLGKRLGFDVRAVLFDQPVTSFAREAVLTSAAGGGVISRGFGYLGTAIRGVRAYRAADRPYLILPGASTPLAVLGYVDAMLELGEQVRRGEAPRPDIIVVPCGSGGTLVGLAIGVALLGWPTIVTGVRITELLASNRLTARWIFEATARLLRRHGARIRFGAGRFRIHHGAIGGGYGHATPAAIAAIPEVLRLIGVPGEVTYSGKGIAGLISVARANPSATILYWHTLSSVRPQVAKLDPAALGSSFADVFAGPTSI